MSQPLDLINQGRGWLQEGEAPDAVLEEAETNVQVASDGKARGAWLLVMAEAQLVACRPARALEQAAEAAGAFKQEGGAEARACEAAALCALVDAQLATQNCDDAIAGAARAAELFRKVEDRKGEASAFLRLARAYLMQMKDPYTAASAALAAAQAFSDLGDKQGAASAQHIAAQAQLLYDPEQALKVAKDAASGLEDAGDYSGRALVLETVSAAKAQIATMQHADQATSLSSRGDSHVPHKWPQYQQQRGERPEDPFATSAYMAAASAPPIAEKKADKANTFMRKSFKWTDGRHATDGAWFRQELRFIPPTSYNV